MKSPRPPLRFGSLELPDDVAPNHFLYSGTTGSGKTTLLRLTMQSALHRVGLDDDLRAVVNDDKQDFVPILKSIAPHADLMIMHPFDERGCAWDLQADIREPQTAVELAFTLVPQLPESQPFFSDATRHLVLGVMLSFLLSGVEWTLADLLRVLQSRRLLKAVLRKHPETREIVALYLRDAKLAANILSTVATKFMAFGPVAAAWEHAKRRVSLTEWSQTGSIWVLGNSEISKTPIRTLNRAMFKRATDITLSQPESWTRRNWFFLDELSEAGKLDGLVSFAKKGRSKGGCLAVSFQSIEGLRDSQLYGQHVSEDFLGQLGHKFIGRVESAASAEWASQLIGDQEIEQISTSRTSSKDGTSRTVSRQNAIRRAVLPGQFMDFPPCNRRNGLTGVFFVPEVGVFGDALDGEVLFDELLWPPADVPAFVSRPVDCQYLRPWTAERATYFGIPERRPPSPKPPEQERRPEIDRDDLDDLFS
ncbi:Coupling protein TraD [Caulifigura coniformis]|uniref:Coupling protein TraD n=1 Tax=Caulifigura coniformis TaxID=2527983 RepID=A0A517S9J2_9PLAN|nr:type IV secretion system DNA-binding domain-containing protein [Caulifigura coniformis]QDT52805.1 Coupling protein TraD [Caulifigura coniformis]